MNRVVHFEINAPDVSKTVPFYETVFGWKVHKWEGPEEYWLVSTGEQGEGINGAIMPSRDGQPRVVNTLQVDDVDEAAAKVEANGGKVVVQKMPIPGVGWVAYCTDPGGVIFGIYKHDESAK
ncbi:MAG: VOC family protein [Planctomycetota bacterium]|jgi:predicted enzyme related to lactoylglutathione lyase